jgi:hypothetical protein
MLNLRAVRMKVTSELFQTLEWSQLSLLSKQVLPDLPRNEVESSTDVSFETGFSSENCITDNDRYHSIDQRNYLLELEKCNEDLKNTNNTCDWYFSARARSYFL